MFPVMIYGIVCAYLLCGWAHRPPSHCASWQLPVHWLLGGSDSSVNCSGYIQLGAVHCSRETRNCVRSASCCIVSVYSHRCTPLHRPRLLPFACRCTLRRVSIYGRSLTVSTRYARESLHMGASRDSMLLRLPSPCCTRCRRCLLFASTGCSIGGTPYWGSGSGGVKKSKPIVALRTVHTVRSVAVRLVRSVPVDADTQYGQYQ